jgi:hypothetical protein
MLSSYFIRSEMMSQLTASQLEAQAPVLWLWLVQCAFDYTELRRIAEPTLETSDLRTWNFLELPLRFSVRVLRHLFTESYGDDSVLRRPNIYDICVHKFDQVC